MRVNLAPGARVNEDLTVLVLAFALISLLNVSAIFQRGNVKREFLRRMNTHIIIIPREAAGFPIAMFVPIVMILIFLKVTVMDRIAITSIVTNSIRAFKTFKGYKSTILEVENFIHFYIRYVASIYKINKRIDISCINLVGTKSAIIILHI